MHRSTRIWDVAQKQQFKGPRYAKETYLLILKHLKRQKPVGTPSKMEAPVGIIFALPYKTLLKEIEEDTNE